MANNNSMPINGRIVDLEGRPVPGVVVKVESVQVPKEGDLTSWIEAVKKGEPPWTVYRYIDHEVKVPENARHETTTDQDGRFRIEALVPGLGARTFVWDIYKGDKIYVPTNRKATAHEVKPGEALDVGDVAVKVFRPN